VFLAAFLVTLIAGRVGGGRRRTPHRI